MRSCSGERSCTSSTTMWPKDRTSSSSADGRRPPPAGVGLGSSPAGQNPTSSRARSIRSRFGPARAGARPRRGPRTVRASSTRAASAAVQGTSSSERLRGRYSDACSAGVRMPWPAAASSGPGAEEVVEQLVGGQPGPHPVEGLGKGRTSGGAGDRAPPGRAPPRRSGSSPGLRPHPGSPRRGPGRRVQLPPASGQSGDRRDPAGPSPRPSSLPGRLRMSRRNRRYWSARRRTTCCSTNRRRALWVPDRRRAWATISADSAAVQPEGRRPRTGRPRRARSGRWRVRTARAITRAMRASPFSRATVGRVGAPDPDLGHQPGDRRQGDPGLAQGGQHLLDVAEEQRVGPDHQHPLALQGEPVGVEEVGGPVQGHRRLAGAGAALDHQDAGQGRADDLVLLALDGGHDVAHVAGPGLARGRPAGRPGPPRASPSVHQAGAVRPRPVRSPTSTSAGPVAGAGEVLVLDPDDRAAPDGQVATAGQALGIEPGGPVEGLGHRGPPVHDQRLVVARPTRPAGRCGTTPPPRRPSSGSRSIRPKHRAWSPMSSWASRARLVRTTMSRSVRDWNVPPRPRSSTRLEHAVGVAPAWPRGPGGPDRGTAALPRDPVLPSTSVPSSRGVTGERLDSNGPAACRCARPTMAAGRWRLR